jgi:hypothetical protein
VSQSLESHGKGSELLTRNADLTFHQLDCSTGPCHCDASAKTHGSWERIFRGVFWQASFAGINPSQSGAPMSFSSGVLRFREAWFSHCDSSGSTCRSPHAFHRWRISCSHSRRKNRASFSYSWEEPENGLHAGLAVTRTTAEATIHLKSNISA